MNTQRDEHGILRNAGTSGTTDKPGTFAAEKKNEQKLAPLGPTGTRRRSVEELGIHESILMAPDNQPEIYDNLQRSLEPYHRAVSRAESLSAAAARGDEDAIERLAFGQSKEDGLETAGDFFAETFEILSPEEIAPYWERACQALEDGDQFELDRALLDASHAEIDAHPIRLDPAWRRPGATEVAGTYTASKFIGNKVDGLEDHSIAAINKHVRSDIEEAKKAGWLPASLKVSVRKPDGAHAVTMLVTSVPDDLHYVPHPHGDDMWMRQSPATKEIEHRLEQIAKQYGNFQYDAHESYHSDSFHLRVNFK